MARKDKQDGFWTTLPGTLTGLAAVITAITALTLGLYKHGVVGPRQLGGEKPPTVKTNSSLLDARAQAATGKMHAALQDPRWRWRTVESLAKIAGLPEDQTLDVLRSMPDVVLSTDESGRRIARLNNR